MPPIHNRFDQTAQTNQSQGMDFGQLGQALNQILNLAQNVNPVSAGVNVGQSMMQQMNPYQEGANKALKKLGEQHVMEASASGVPPDQLASHPILQNQPVQTPTQQIPQTPQAPQQFNPYTGPQAPQSIPGQQIPGQGTLGVQQGNFQPHPLGVLANLLGGTQGGYNPQTGTRQIPGLLGGLITSSPEMLTAMATYNKGKPGGEQAPTLVDQMMQLQQFEQAKKQGLVPSNTTFKTGKGGVSLGTGTTSQLKMTPEEIEPMAQKMIAGELSPSQLSRMQKSQVISRAIEIDPNFNPAAADVNFWTSRTSSSNFERLYNNVEASEGTFKKNAAFALKLSENYERSNSPIINKAIIAYKQGVQGDPETQRLIGALKTAAWEYAKVTTNNGFTGNLTDTAAQHMEDLVSALGSKGQIRAMLDPENGAMIVDASNRLASMDETRANIKSTYTKRHIAGEGKKSAAKTITLPSGKTIILGE